MKEQRILRVDGEQAIGLRLTKDEWAVIEQAAALGKTKWTEFARTSLANAPAGANRKKRLIEDALAALDVVTPFDGYALSTLSFDPDTTTKEGRLTGWKPDLKASPVWDMSAGTFAVQLLTNSDSVRIFEMTAQQAILLAKQLVMAAQSAPSTKDND